jgi:O-antigen/teichoic acid export membrane protein
MNWRALFAPKMSRELWYAPILGAAIGLTLLRLLLLAKILDVTNFAQFSAGTLVANTFTMLSCFGMYVVLQRDLPVLLVRQRERRGTLLLVQCLLIAVLAALAVAALSAPLSPLAGLSPTMFALAVWYGLSQQLFLIVTVESRSRGQLVKFANQNFLRALAILITGLLVAQATGSALWILLAEATVAMALVVASVRALLQDQRLGVVTLVRLAMRRAGQLPWNSALVLLVSSVVSFLLLSSDRWLAASQIGAADFARYSFVGIVLVFAPAIQSVVGAAVFPLLARRYGLAGPVAAFADCARYSLGLLAVATVMSVPTWFLFTRAMDHWYPAYAGSGGLLAVLLIVASLRVSDFWASYLIIVGKERLLLKLNLFAALAGTGVWLVGVSQKSSAGLTPVDVGWLALCLTGASYVSMAWACRNSLKQNTQ